QINSSYDIALEMSGEDTTGGGFISDDQPVGLGEQVKHRTTTETQARVSKVMNNRQDDNENKKMNAARKRISRATLKNSDPVAYKEKKEQEAARMRISR